MSVPRARLVDRYEQAMTKTPANVEEIRPIILEVLNGIPDTFSTISTAEVIAYAVMGYFDAKRRVIRNQEGAE